MRILIDLDGIVVDLLSKWLGRYNEDFEDCLTVDMVDSWHLYECTKPECSEQDLLSYIREPGFFGDLKPLPGALEGVRTLVSMGHKVKFATAITGADSAKCKIEWIDKYFSDVGITGASSFLCHEKHWINADLLIDDKPETLARWDAKGGLTATIEYPYNAHLIVDCMAPDYSDTENAWETIIKFVRDLSNVRFMENKRRVVGNK